MFLVTSALHRIQQSIHAYACAHTCWVKTSIFWGRFAVGAVVPFILRHTKDVNVMKLNKTLKIVKSFIVFIHPCDETDDSFSCHKKYYLPLAND